MGRRACPYQPYIERDARFPLKARHASLKTDRSAVDQHRRDLVHRGDDHAHRRGRAATATVGVRRGHRRGRRWFAGALIPDHPHRQADERDHRRLLDRGSLGHGRLGLHDGIGAATLATGGCKCATVVVYVLGDLAEEPTETFHLNLSNPSRPRSWTAKGLGRCTTTTEHRRWSSWMRSPTRAPVPRRST